MAEKSETVHIVMRKMIGVAGADKVPVRCADDRVDAREYAKKMNLKSTRYHYTVKSVKKL